MSHFAKLNGKFDERLVKATLAGVFAVSLSALPSETLGGCGFEFMDSFETPCPIYYADTDEDGFGDPDNFTQTCGAQPPDTVEMAGDCDDGNASINPDAEEPVPDNLYIDENCDGVDGDVDLAVFVSQFEGFDTVFCGTIDEPCQTIVKGLQRTKEIPLQQIYLQQANYFESLDIDSSVAIFGGYALGDWSRAFRTVNQSRVEGFPNDVRNYTARVMGVSAEFHNLFLMGPGTPQTSADLNSYVIIADTGSTVVIRDNQLDQGTAANGSLGNPGTSASQVAADSGDIGTSGSEFATSCDLVTPDGGLGGTNPSATDADGGEGGDGGSMDTSCTGLPGLEVCDNCNATSGFSGHPADQFSYPFGTGGDGGSSCGEGGDGGPGVAASNGSGGSGGNGGGFIGGFWVSSPGVGGQPGTDGGGGGGGGGAGGCDIGIDSRGSGGGGGGAGGAAAVSSGGGGEGGGGSFGTYLTDATLLTFDTVFVRGNGGKGGNGGDSGLGQPGGSGGSGGPAVGDSMVAGDGGDGADGGDSGAGGGGAGGPSCAIVDINSTVTLKGSLISGGSPGIGGSGGFGESNSAGSPGDPGALCEILEPS